MEPEASLPCSQEPATGPYLNQMHTIFNLPPDFLRSILIFLSMPRSFEWSLSFRFSDQKFVCISNLYHACYMPRPCLPPRFDNPNNIWSRIRIVKILIVQLSPLSCCSLHFRSKRLNCSRFYCSKFRWKCHICHSCFNTTVTGWLPQQSNGIILTFLPPK
jgi:hypothetical protein